jgi:Domain of unknown function (DUF5624)
VSTVTPNYSPHPEFSALYKNYTSGPDSIAKHLTRRMVQMTESDPLLVVTGADVVLFPGAGRQPVVESFRHSTRGFVELTSISHLGPAVAWLIRLRELNDPVWRSDLQRLIEQIDRTRRINTADIWRSDIAVPALAGYEAKIADMVDYSCAVTRAFLIDGLADESHMTFEYLRENYLDPVGSAAVPIPINDMMVATFALAFLDIAHRMIRWLGTQGLDWERLMVLLTGRTGRATAGLSWATNNMCHIMWKVSEQRLSPERVYVAPLAPSFVLADIRDAEHLRSLNGEYRDLWCNTRASTELARLMFKGYPVFNVAVPQPPPVAMEMPMIVREMPQLRSPDDRFGAIARLRVTMEDPTQLLVNAVTYIVDRLCECDNDPAKVFIPGFTSVQYPPRQATS